MTDTLDVRSFIAALERASQHFAASNAKRHFTARCSWLPDPCVYAEVFGRHRSGLKDNRRRKYSRASQLPARDKRYRIGARGNNNIVEAIGGEPDLNKRTLADKR